MKTIQNLITGLALLALTSAVSYGQNDSINKRTTSHQISIFIDNGNNVAIRALDLDSDRSNYSLKVFAENGDLVYGTLYSKKNGVVDAFDLSELPKGNYEFVVYSKRKPVYTRSVTKLSAPANISDEQLAVELTNTSDKVYVKR